MDAEKARRLFWIQVNSTEGQAILHHLAILMQKASMEAASVETPAGVVIVAHRGEK